MKPRGSGEGDYDLSPTRQYTVVSKMPKGKRGENFQILEHHDRIAYA